MEGRADEVKAPPVKKRAWFQIRLSSLIVGQLVAGCLVVANMKPARRLRPNGDPWPYDEWYGFPCQAFRRPDDFSWSSEAVIANICVCVTLPILAVIILEIIHRVWANGARETITALTPRFITFAWCAFASLFMIHVWLKDFKIWISPEIYFPREHWNIELGWPYRFELDNFSWHFLWNARGFFVDLYIALAWIIPTTLLLEWYLRRRDRLKTPPLTSSPQPSAQCTP